MRHEISLSKEICLSMPQKRERTSEIPYVFAIGFISDTFLTYGGEEELNVKRYTDVIFQLDNDYSRSQLDYQFCLNGGTIEAEYIETNEARKEAV